MVIVYVLLYARVNHLVFLCERLHDAGNAVEFPSVHAVVLLSLVLYFPCALYGFHSVDAGGSTLSHRHP